MPEVRNDGTQHAPQTWAIYNRLEATVAEALVKSGEVELLKPQQVPENLKTNNVGEPVLCAVIVPGNKLARFHRLLSDAYLGS